MKTYENLRDWIISNVDPAEIEENDGPKEVTFWFVAVAEALEFQESCHSLSDVAYYFKTGIPAITEEYVTEYLTNNKALWDEDAEFIGETRSWAEVMVGDLNRHFKGSLINEHHS